MIIEWQWQVTMKVHNSKLLNLDTGFNEILKHCTNEFKEINICIVREDFSLIVFVLLKEWLCEMSMFMNGDASNVAVFLNDHVIREFLVN